jgi:hypothetical protein
MEEHIKIAESESESTWVDCLGRLICGVVMPASWTAANLTFIGAPGKQSSTNQGDPDEDLDGPI